MLMSLVTTICTGTLTGVYRVVGAIATAWPFRSVAAQARAHLLAITASRTLSSEAALS